MFSREKRVQRRHPITGGLTLAGVLMAFLFTKDKKRCFSCWEVQGGRTGCGEEGREEWEEVRRAVCRWPLRSSLALILLLFVVI